MFNQSSCDIIAYSNVQTIASSTIKAIYIIWHIFYADNCALPAGRQVPLRYPGMYSIVITAKDSYHCLPRRSFSEGGRYSAPGGQAGNKKMPFRR